jgi:hypothetical protein
MSDATAKVELTPEQRFEKRKGLLQVLLIGLVAVTIVYVGFEIGVGMLCLGLWIIGKFSGV